MHYSSNECNCIFAGELPPRNEGSLATVTKHAAVIQVLSSTKLYICMRGTASGLLLGRLLPCRQVPLLLRLLTLNVQ